MLNITKLVNIPQSATLIRGIVVNFHPQSSTKQFSCAIAIAVEDEFCSNYFGILCFVLVCNRYMCVGILNLTHQSLPLSAKNAIFAVEFGNKLADRENMEYISVSEFAKQYNVSERTIRNYCAVGKIVGATLVGKSWMIPADAELPKRGKQRKRIMPLLATLREQKQMQLRGGIYHRTQIDMTYNSNHIEGSRLTHDQTRYIFETNTIGITDESVNVDDIIETSNHFRCIDYIIENAEQRLSEDFIKHLHLLLKSGTSDSRKEWFRVGEYKQYPNEVGGIDTTMPEDVAREMKALLKEYNAIKDKSLEDIVDLHQRFEVIHPFQDGNGRVGRLIMFKECMANDIVPFIITEELKMFYYRGLREWDRVRGFLLDTCLTAQDNYKMLLDYFRVPYK